MANYSFKSKYWVNGVDIDSMNLARYYYSPVVPVGGDASMQNPDKVPLYQGVAFANILANGVYQPFSANSGDNAYCVGNGMFSTFLKAWESRNGTRGSTSFISDMTIEQALFDGTNGSAGARIVYFYNCRFLNSIKFPPVDNPGGAQILNFRNCIFEGSDSWNQYVFQNPGYFNNSYINSEDVNVLTSLSLYENCNITIDSVNKLTTYLNTYIAFSDCKFKIGNESGWKALNGTTETNLRADFLARCVAQGWVAPVGTEFGDTNIPMYRWVFANGASKNGIPILNGIIHVFETRRFITFGYEAKREGFIISTDKTMKDSINPGNPNLGLQFGSNSLSLPATTDITNRVTSYATSGIKWLGGKMKVTDLNIIHNMPVDFGVMIDNTSTIDFTPIASGNIQAGELYLVRSSDKKYAAITYNGVGYNTALTNNVQVFRGVTGITAFAVASGNPVIYKLTDFVQHQTLEVRIVNRIPSGNIVAGTALTSGYWYLVEHDADQSNTTDYVTYGGANYKVGSSFIASGTASFTKSGNVHLRRCWKDTFDFATETLDKTFWQNEQKPKWCKIVLGDKPRCLMNGNSNKQNEMKTDANGDYITTGNPEFYQSENGEGGIAIPTFPIQGTYLQMRITVTTINPI